MMVLLKIHRFSLRYDGNDYQTGDTVEMDEAKAKELTEKYGSAFTYEPMDAETEEQEAEAMQELPAPDVADVVVKPRKRTSRKK